MNDRITFNVSKYQYRRDLKRENHKVLKSRGSTSQVLIKVSRHESLRCPEIREYQFLVKYREQDICNRTSYVITNYSIQNTKQYNIKLNQLNIL